MFLEKIDDTNDLKKLNRKELKELANEVRAALRLVKPADIVVPI